MDSKDNLLEICKLSSMQHATSVESQYGIFRSRVLKRLKLLTSDDDMISKYIKLMEQMSPFIHIQSGVHCLSHTARAAFWRDLASAFPDLFDFFVDTSPKKAEAQKQLLAGLNAFFLHHLHGKDEMKECEHCKVVTNMSS